jgi:hypothetical protein
LLLREPRGAVFQCTQHIARILSAAGTALPFCRLQCLITGKLISRIGHEQRAGAILSGLAGRPGDVGISSSAPEAEIV